MFILTGILLILAFLFYASYSIRSGVYIKTLSKNNKKGKVISITFDDGPHHHQTSKILDILKEYNIKATFFCIGKNAEANNSLLKRMDGEGHLIGNHSSNHSFFFPLQSVNKISQDITSCEKTIENIINKKTNLFRPPFGVTNPLIAKAVNKLDYITVGWNIRSFDTAGESTEKTLKRIRRKLRNGSVLLLHDSLSSSDILLKMILEMLIMENYKIISLEELFDIKTYK